MSSRSHAQSAASARSAEQRFASLGYANRPAAKPLASYVPFVVTGDLAFVSGHGPLDPEGRPVAVGRLGEQLTVAQGRDAARLATINLLASLRGALGSLDRVSAVCQLTGYVRCAPGFSGLDDVMAGSSELLAEVFGDDIPIHVTTCAVTECVLGLAVTVDAVFAVDSGSAD